MATDVCCLHDELTGEAAQPIGNDDALGMQMTVRHRAISSLLKPFSLDRRMAIGWPSWLVCTAATQGVLPGAPQPRFPPRRSPPR